MTRFTRTRERRRSSRRAGFATVELLVAVVVIVVAAGGSGAAIVRCNALERANAETTRAHQGARRALEGLRAADPALVFAARNSVPGDDPAGALGPNFAVLGLDPVPGDPDGLVGRIVFPETLAALGAVELRETLSDPTFGLPRDLNADGAIDAADRAADWKALPVRVVVEWRGRTGDRSLSLDTILRRP